MKNLSHSSSSSSWPLSRLKHGFESRWDHHLSPGTSAASRTLEESGETLRMLARLVEADASGRPPLPRQMPPSMQEMLTLAGESPRESSRSDRWYWDGISS